MTIKMQVYGAWLFSGKEEPKNEIPESWKLVKVIPGRFESPKDVPLNQVPIVWDWIMLASGDMGICYSRSEFLEEIGGVK